MFTWRWLGSADAMHINYIIYCIYIYYMCIYIYDICIHTYVRTYIHTTYIIRMEPYTYQKTLHIIYTHGTIYIYIIIDSYIYIYCCRYPLVNSVVYLLASGFGLGRLSKRCSTHGSADSLLNYATKYGNRQKGPLRSNGPDQGLLSYCWWKKSCTTWDVKNPVNNGINYLLVQDFFHQQYCWKKDADISPSEIEA